MALFIPVSVGELFDKITILQIKAHKLRDGAKRENVLKELQLLDEVRARLSPAGKELEALVEELRQTNLALWDVEDALRICEKNRDFQQHFIELARSVYITNDRRSELKYKINMLQNSEIIEEKSYEPYQNS